MTESVALALAYLLDLIIGDPRWLPHPVKLIGRAIEKCEIYLREKVLDLECDVVALDVVKDGNAGNRKSNKIAEVLNKVMSLLRKDKKMSLDAYEKMTGVILVIVIAGSVFLVFYLLIWILSLMKFSAVSSYISFAVFVYFISTTIATRDLLKSGRAVITSIGKGDIETSRKKLSMIVGRDTEALEEEGVLRATIETFAESASDGIVSPLFYFAIGGLPLAMTYKAINTLDSMVGYRNEKYINLGWASARLDDIANYIPARITAFLIIVSSYVINAFRYLVYQAVKLLETAQNRVGRFFMKLFERVGRNMKKPDFAASHNSFEIMMRDGKKHASPNAGMPEAAMAGALGVRLGGPSVYEGKKVNKSYLGNTVRTMENRTVPVEELYMEAALSAITITKLTSFLGFLLVLGVL